MICDLVEQNLGIRYLSCLDGFLSRNRSGVGFYTELCQQYFTYVCNVYVTLASSVTWWPMDERTRCAKRIMPAGATPRLLLILSSFVMHSCSAPSVDAEHFIR